MSLSEEKADAAPYRAPHGQAPQPLDRALRAMLPKASWGEVRRLIATGKVQCNGHVITDMRQRIRGGDEITICIAAPRPSSQDRLRREAIVFADKHVVVVRKPAGISTVPYEPTDRGTLDQLTRAHLSRERKAQGGSAQNTLGVVQRLDKDTSGLIVFARTLAAKQHLAQQFRAHTVLRSYLAIAYGDVAEQTFRSRLVANRGDGIRGSTSNPRLGQLAITHVTVKARLQGAALIQCRLETGRTHQIRIHLSESGCPLVGERVYIRGYPGPRMEAPRLMLHAAELGFVHPHTMRLVTFHDPMPADMETLLSKLSPDTPFSK